MKTSWRAELEDWVPTRFALVEDRVARLESEAWGDEAEGDLAESLTENGLTVGKLRTMLAKHDPRCPVKVQITADQDDPVEVWEQQSRDDERSSSTVVAYRRIVLLRVKRERLDA